MRKRFVRMSRAWRTRRRTHRRASDQAARGLHPARRRHRPRISERASRACRLTFLYERKVGTNSEAETLTVAGREVAISHPEKVLFPQPKHTKLDLARYYVAVAEGALRGAGGRPNMLVRYPD